MLPEVLGRSIKSAIILPLHVQALSLINVLFAKKKATSAKTNAEQRSKTNIQ
jgi:hypothetical protein